MVYQDYQIFFTKIMSIKFRKLIEMGKAITYLDDILLNADSIGEMIDGILPIFFELLRESGMKLAPKKTEFFKEEVAFLGFYISSKGIRPINKKVDGKSNNISR